MTLMKLRIGRKRDEASLRPLTEKEIQKRLYGAYQEEGGLKEEIESILAEPRRKEKGFVFSPEKKASFRRAWQKGVSSFAKAFAGFAKFSAKFLQKTASGWGAGILIVALLFLGIHVLNGYRVKAMKASRPQKQQPPAQTRFVEAGSGEVPASVAPLPTVQAPPPPPPPSPRKPYVIQVCTYANQTDAEGLAEKMRAANLPAFVEPMGRTNGKTFYPVFLGRFETFREAQAKLKEFRGRPVSGDFQDSFIRTL